ncbi:TetR/AcrR family transcriptional regulator [Hydrogenophilus thiooxidans]|uniref:TetR/AcrR family transcriptional regulator n=1 Tax=Hydrogenophilus thiooxidans TaxID=2820326 RepID=UPI001C21DBE6|nr:TetR/AcrR family transcriptional regulator [Hydrogenophilus thiooxidans]
MARTRSPNFEEQREAILEKAAMLFARMGFHAASMATLAKACGVSKALLYHYYRDKEHILFDVADAHVERLCAIVRETLAKQPLTTPQEAEAALALLITAFLDEYAHAQHRHIVLVQDVKHLPPELAATIRAKQRQVVRGFERVIAALAPRDTPPHIVSALTMTLFGMINWTFTWLRPDGPLTHRDLAPLVTALFLRGLSAAAALPPHGPLAAAATHTAPFPAAEAPLATLPEAPPLNRASDSVPQPFGDPQ